MTRAILIIIGLLCAVVTAAGIIHLQPFNAEWGPEQNGYRFSLTAEKYSIIYGEPINMTLRIMNVSDSPKPLSGESMWDNLVITGQNNSPVRHISCGYQTMDSEPYQLKPGEWCFLDKRDIAREYHFCKPDKYIIQWCGTTTCWLSENNWRVVPACSNKIEITVRNDHSNPYAEVHCRLVHILPDKWNTYLGGTHKSVLLLYPQCGLSNNITVFHTDQLMEPAPYGSNLIGRNKWGYAYIDISPECQKRWPTAKDDIIKALEIH
ncbi:MAG: hypothetical protein AAB038_03235 [Planctomycetota bacterium]